MTPERLHDALALLPEDLLTPVDALRQKKRLRWQPIAALAACMCLAAGLWLLPISAANEKGNGGIMESAGGRGDGFMGSVTDQVIEESSGTYALTATVTEVSEEYCIAQPEGTEPVTVQLGTLEQCPTLSPGQTIRIFCKEVPDMTVPLIPYRIEIIEE